MAWLRAAREAAAWTAAWRATATSIWMTLYLIAEGATPRTVRLLRQMEVYLGGTETAG